MPFYKSPSPDSSSVSLHDIELDIVNGFVEISRDILTPEIETTLIKHLGFTVANDADVENVLAVQSLTDQQKQDNAERTALLSEIKAWGLKIDGRKNVAWVRERYDEFVKQGLIKPGQDPAAPPEAPDKPIESDPAANTDEPDAPTEDPDPADPSEQESTQEP